jgi:hypothetical protein
MFRLTKDITPYLLTLLMTFAFIGCSDGEFGADGDGAFSGSNKLAAKKVDIGEDGTCSVEQQDDQGNCPTSDNDLGDDLGDNGNDLGDGDDNGGKGDDDEDGIDWDDDENAGLREPMRVSQTAGDEDSHLLISFLTSTGGGPDQKVDFKEDEKSTKEAPELCRKKGITKVKIIYKSDEDSITQAAAQLPDEMRWTRRGNAVHVILDLDGCMFGTCLDPGKDNEYLFECPDSKIEVEGLSI